MRVMTDDEAEELEHAVMLANCLDFLDALAAGRHQMVVVPPSGEPEGQPDMILVAAVACWRWDESAGEVPQ